MKGCRSSSDEEVACVCRSFGGTYAARDRPLFILGVKRGFRISEFLSLRVGGVDQHGHVVARLIVQRRHMKAKREGRTVIVYPDAQAALQTRLEALNGQERAR